MSTSWPEILIIAALLALLGLLGNVIAGVIHQKTPAVTTRRVALSVVAFIVASVALAAYQTERSRPSETGSAQDGVIPSSEESRSIDPAAPAASDPTASPSPVATSPTFPANFEGAWEGKLQVAGDGYWIMQVDIRAGSREARVEYPEFCAGTWSLVGASGSSLRIRERITSKIRFCDDPSTVILTAQNDGNLHLRYLPEIGTYEASAILRPRS